MDLLESGAAAPAAQPLVWPQCRPDHTQVLLVGVFHMADAGAIVDVSTPRRQSELDDLARRIAGFKPAKVAVERPFTSADTLNASYEAYRKGEALSTRNEAWQIGFRTARLLDHPRVHPVDFRMNLGTPSLSEYYKEHPEALARVMEANKRAQAADAAETATVRERSLAEILAWMADRAHLENPGFFNEILPLGSGENYAGAEMLARWYDRNLRIAQNLFRIVDPSDRRVVLIIGNGHVAPLKHLLESTARFCPVSAKAVLERPTSSPASPASPPTHSDPAPPTPAPSRLGM